MPDAQSTEEQHFAREEGPAAGERFTELARTRDPKVRDELIVEHLDLARRLAKRFAHRNEPFDDLYQVASMALIKAVDRFRPEFGCPFEAFAVTTILGEIKRHFRDQGWAVRAPRRLQELYLEIRPTAEDLGHQLGRSPTPSEVAERLGASVEDVVEAMEAGHSYRSRSLDAMVQDGEHASAVSKEDVRLGQLEDLDAVKSALHAVADRERRILKLRFYDDLTQSEIASRIGLSQMQISRLLNRTLSTLRSD